MPNLSAAAALPSIVDTKSEMETYLLQLLTPHHFNSYPTTMSTYFHGNSEIQAACGSGGDGRGSGAGEGEGLQTLILMNPTGSNNFVFLNSDPPGVGGCGGNSFINAPQQLLGIPLASPTNQSSSATSSSLLHHGFLRGAQYKYNNQKAVVDHVEARETPRARRGLSLSLSSHLPVYGVAPKYLKAAQELLDEVVNVGKGVKSGGSTRDSTEVVDDGLARKSEQQPLLSNPAAVGGEGGRSGWEKGGKRGGELTTAEKQEIQTKKSKLVYMLDEVEQRYKNYKKQVKMVASTFEQTCGIGSAKSYTSLALRTISKQFRSIKDAILCQVEVASKSLGEEEEEEDNQLRQQKALKQLGMLHHNNAWRSQRGLPERSVSVLRSWLFEHFLHPYPKDSDKIMLARQAGLTKGQVSNWFINARVRLWKPMVEEMYSEEMKENNGSEKNEHTTFKTTSSDPEKTATMENRNEGYDVLNQTSNFHLIESLEMGSISNENLKKQGSSDMFTSVSMDTSKPDESDNEPMREDGFSLFGGPTNFINGVFSTYPIGELASFTSPYSGNINGVSLSLGLPHCENLAMSGPHQPFLSNQNIELVREVEIGDEHDYRTIPHRVIVPEYTSTFRNTRGLMQNYHQAL